MDYKKSCMMLAILALLFALIAFSFANEVNDNVNIFQVVVNNTDLYPAQRTVNTIYYANDSPIAVYLIFHAVGTGAAQTFDSNFSINNSVVLDRDFKTSSGAGFHDHWSFYTIVPKGSNYSVTNSTNVFTIEWREYPILSGRNGTLSVNQTFVGNSFNSTYDATSKAFDSNYSAQTFPNISITYLQSNVSALQNNDTKSRFSAYNSSNFATTLGNCVSKLIVMDTVDFDTFSDYNVQTGNYTVNMTGYYIVSPQAGFSPPSTPIGYNIYINKNGVIVGQFDAALNYTDFGQLTAGGQKLFLFTKGDNISVSVRGCPYSGTSGGALIGKSYDTWLNIIGI